MPIGRVAIAGDASAAEDRPRASLPLPCREGRTLPYGRLLGQGAVSEDHEQDEQRRRAHCALRASSRGDEIAPAALAYSRAYGASPRK